MHHLHRDQRGQSLVIVLSLITILFLLGSALAVHASAALRATRASEGEADDLYAADAATELGIWWQRNGKAGNPPAQTINGITTSTTITSVGGGGSCPADVAARWVSGFESGALQSGTANISGGFSATTPGQVSIVSSPARSGSYALSLHQTVSANATGNIIPPQPYAPVIVARFSIRFTVLPTADTVLAYFITNNSGTETYKPHLGYHQSTGKFEVGFGTGTTTQSFLVRQDGSVTVLAGTWHSIDLRVTVNTNPRTIEWYVDGLAQPTASASETVAANYSNVGLGMLNSPFSDWTGYYDDVLYSSTSADFPIGDVRITRLLPDGMGTSVVPTNFQNNDSTALNATSWQRLDEVPMTSTADYVKGVAYGGSGESYVEITFQDTTETCIRSANMVAALNSASTQSNNLGLNSVMSGIRVGGWSGDASETFLRYTQMVVSTGPPGVGPWTQAAINSIKAQFGSGDVNPNPYMQALLLELAYRPVSGGPATVTIVGTGGASTATTTYPDAGAGVPTLSTWTVTK